MSDKINLRKNAASLDISPEFDAYSKVEITVSTPNSNEKQVVSVGTDYGRKLDIQMLQCSDTEQAREAAQRILDSLRGFQYQPYSAKSCLIDPSVELGDGISISDIYSGVYNSRMTLGALIHADLTAPQDEAIEHEYSTKQSTNKVLTREMGKAYSRLTINSDEITAEVARATEAEGELLSAIQMNADAITAKVSKSGGSGGFSWSLTDSSWTVYSGSTEIFKVDSAGATVKGVITATSGKIGGFNIGEDGLYRNLTRFGGSSTTGVYLGTDGIQLGQNFKVDTGGNMSISGTLNVGGASITASNLRTGATHGNRVGGGMSGSGTSSNHFSCGYMNVTDLLTAVSIKTNSINMGSGATIEIGSGGSIYAPEVDAKYGYFSSSCNAVTLKYGSNYSNTLKGKATVTIDGHSYTFATAQ